MKKYIIVILALTFKIKLIFADLPPLPDFNSNNASVPQLPTIQPPEERPINPPTIPTPSAPIQAALPQPEKIELPDLQDILGEQKQPKLPEIPMETTQSTTQAEPEQSTKESSSIPKTKDAVEIETQTPTNLLPVVPNISENNSQDETKLPEIPAISTPSEEKKTDPFRPKNLIPITPVAPVIKEQATPSIDTQPQPLLPQEIAPSLPPEPVATTATKTPPPPITNVLPLSPKQEEQKSEIDIQEQSDVDADIDLQEDMFVVREMKVFENPNDDVVLGQVTEESELENMDFKSYANLYQQMTLANSKKQNKDKVEKFIKNSKSKTHRKIDPDSLKMMMDNNPEFALSFSKDEVNYLTISAVKNGDLELLRLMIDNYYSLDINDKDGNSLLMLAVMNKQEKIVAYLLRKGINPNIANIDNQTPLLIASRNHYHLILRMLKESGAFGDIDPNDMEIEEEFNVKF